MVKQPKQILGNLGLRDIALALKWVKSNIGDYGGDADKVTVFGQSAGSMAIRWDSHILHNYTKN